MVGFSVHIQPITGNEHSKVDNTCKRIRADDSRLAGMSCSSIGIKDPDACRTTKLWLDNCSAYDVKKRKVVSLPCDSRASGYLCDGVKPVTTIKNDACKSLPWCTQAEVRYKEGSACPDELPLQKRGDSFTRNFYCPVKQVDVKKCKVVLGNSSEAREYCSKGEVDRNYNWLMMPSGRR